MKISSIFALIALVVISVSVSANNQIRVPVLKDINPDPNIVEVKLTALVAHKRYKSGGSTEVWSYNGIVPGPTIEAEVGQTLIVHFKNKLPEPTTVHWHGLEVPARMDGSNISQGAVAPGGSFRYEFKLARAATYWYHPHANSNEQVEKGLHGALIVRGDDDRRVRIPRNREYTLLLDDVLLDEQNRLVPFATQPGNALTPVERAEQLFNSRQGNLLLVNGYDLPTIRVRNGRAIRLRLINPANGRFMRLSAPDQDMYQIGTDGGLLEHVRDIPEVEMIYDHHSASFISNPNPDQGLLLTPSERADVVLVPRGKPGDEVLVMWHDIPMGRHRTFNDGMGGVGFSHAHDDGKRPPMPLFKLKFGNGHKKFSGWKPVLPLRIDRIPQIEIDGNAERLPVVFGHAPPKADGSVVFFNAVRMTDEILMALDNLQLAAEDDLTLGPVPGMVMPPMFQPQPFKLLAASDALQARVGETREWYLVNFTGGDHTFHSHGFFFQPLEVIQVNLDGRVASERVIKSSLPLEIKDSILLPRRSGMAGRSWTILRAAVRFDDNDLPPYLRRDVWELVAYGKTSPINPGDLSGGWLAHCHFLEHADSGMMNFLNLFYPE